MSWITRQIRLCTGIPVSLLTNLISFFFSVINLKTMQPINYKPFLIFASSLIINQTSFFYLSHRFTGKSHTTNKLQTFHDSLHSTVFWYKELLCILAVEKMEHDQKIHKRVCGGNYPLLQCFFLALHLINTLLEYGKALCTGQYWNMCHVGYMFFLTHRMHFVCQMTMQQHFIDTSISITMITESKSTTGKKNYANVDTLLENSRQYLAMGWEGGKLLHRLARKEKLTHVTERETNVLTHTQVPHSCSVRELHFLPLLQAQPAGKTFLYFFFFSFL